MRDLAPAPAADLRLAQAHGAGLRWLVKLNCRTRLPGPFNPAVTGERRVAHMTRQEIA